MISYKDIADLFGELELHLIRSLKRNLQRHKEWEADEGFDWTAWQAEKIRNLNKYRKQNKKIAKYFLSKILPDTKQMLQEQYDEYNETDPSFFKINNRRMDALIEEMTSIEERVTRAAVRNMDDVYRKTISKAALGLNSGTLTYQQAVDMATKDFLNKGINCVQYKNGRMVNIASYAEMALRTNATRAQLIGMGTKMEQLGVDTVLVSQYGGCSPTCLPWQGKVYINDVFMDFDGKKGISWGISRNGKEYMLLSYAVKNGLFHPNCRHHMGIYHEGITRMPLPLDKETVNRNYALEQQQRALEREIRLYKLLEAGTLDEVKKQAYTDQLKLSQAKLREFINKNSDVLRRDLWRERLVPETYSGNDVEKGTSGNEKSVFFGTNDVDLEYIKSKEYRHKFTQLTPNTKVNDKIRDFISGALTKNNGTNTESLLVIDADTGVEVIRKTGRKDALGVELTDEEIARIKNYKGRKIGIHNHPTNLYPTGSDFVASGYREYEFGVIGTHDGKVFIYSVGNIPVRAEFIDRTIDSYMEKAYNKSEIMKRESYKEALKQLYEEYGLKWRELR